MNPEHYQRVQELFLACLEVEPARREAFLNDSKAASEVLVEVRDMLEHHDDEGIFGEESLGAQRHLITEALDLEPEPVARLFGDLTFRPESLPELIGGFRILDVLGEGGNGTVFRAAGPDEKLVALKVLRAAERNSQAARRFRREIRILEELHHPRIVRVFSSGVDEVQTGVETLTLPWFAMELIEGRPLGSWARDESPSLEESCRKIADVLDALDYAHGLGILHRDLKPQNLMVTAEDEIKVLDFGAAAVKKLGENENESVLTMTGQIIGTMAYMSPEQLGGRSEGVDARADIYAIGAILYELVAGRTPYDLRRLSLIACLKKLRFEEPTPLRELRPELPRDFISLVEAALAKEVENRPLSAASFARALRDLAL